MLQPARHCQGMSSSDPTASRKALAVADSQAGVVSRLQLIGAGVSGTSISRWVAAGRLQRVHRGVYTVGHRRLAREGFWWAAVLAAGPQVWLSHFAAAAAWGLLRPRAGRIDVVGPHLTARRGGPIRRHRSPLAAEDRAERDGLPVTSVIRTIIDLADVATERQLAEALDQALLMNLLDVGALRRRAAQMPGRRGARPLARALARLSDDGDEFLSDAERRVRDAIVEAGLTRPEANPRVPTGPGTWIRPDLVWREPGLVVELDGPHHLMPNQRLLDRERDAVLRAAGQRILRFPVTADMGSAQIAAIVTTIGQALDR